jgi:hypothetical protein
MLKNRMCTPCIILHCLDEHFIIALLCMDEKRGDSSFARKGMLIMFSNQQDGTGYLLLDLIVHSINVITSITVLWYCYNQWSFERFFGIVITNGPLNGSLVLL